VAFTFDGLRALGLSQPCLNTFPPEFRAGMADREHSRRLGDTEESAPAHWELGGPQTAPIHGLLILNAATRSKLDAWCSEQRAAIERWQNAVVESSTQTGTRPTHDREPFGFLDSVGQPRIKGLKGKGVNTGEFILGYQNEYNFYSISPVMPPTEDPGGILPISANPYHQQAGFHDLGFNGTFVVYRKLQQDVAAFWRFLQAESIRRTGAADPRFMIWLAAKMVGRWPSGVPLVLAAEADRAEIGPRDDFLYAEDDPAGLACPLGAHIRRTHPRDQIRPAGPTESLHMSARHRILRRGRVFGPALFDPMILDRPDDPNTRRILTDLRDDGQERGIHFFCVNASIRSQFEFVQQAWVNNPRFNGLVSNRDPLGGDNDPSAAAPSAMHVPGRPTGLRTMPLPRFVTVRGGAYFFMPSITALRYLAEQS
jgi:Dyp-type peroxidase family